MAVRLYHAYDTSTIQLDPVYGPSMNHVYSCPLDPVYGPVPNSFYAITYRFRIASMTHLPILELGDMTPARPLHVPFPPSTGGQAGQSTISHGVATLGPATRPAYVGS